MSQKLDEDISRWILEFALHQQMNDKLLNTLFTILPLPIADSKFKKTMLLRSIRSEILKTPISEKILTLIEQIEEIHFQEGVRVCEEMKKAYCAAVVHCTLQFIDDTGLYVKAVKRIWMDRVCKMMRAEMPGLISEEVENWGIEIEEAAWDYSMRKKLLDKSEENDVKDVIRVYVDKAFQDLGPSFLEMLADALGDCKVSEALGLCGGVCNDLNPDEPDSPAVSVVEDKVIDNSSPEKSAAGTFRGAGVTDNKGLESDKDATLCSPKTVSIQNENNVANDPIPNELNVAGAVAPELERDQENGDAPNPSVNNGKNLENKPAGTLGGVRIADDEEPEEDDALVSKTAKNKESADAPNPSIDDNNNPKFKKSLMEPNSTARTNKWEDSIDDLSEEGSSSETDKSKVTKPRKRNSIVLNIKKSKNSSKKRQKKIWSTIEEDTLRTGVEKYGKGNWKLILNMYRDIFEERNEVDLKDKWRNMTK